MIHNKIKSFILCFVYHLNFILKTHEITFYRSQYLDSKFLIYLYIDIQRIKYFQIFLFN